SDRSRLGLDPHSTRQQSPIPTGVGPNTGTSRRLCSHRQSTEHDHPHWPDMCWYQLLDTGQLFLRAVQDLGQIESASWYLHPEIEDLCVTKFDGEGKLVE